ncbi:MAG: 16S rRNA (uracil(1498)-N(3))-methyltransferase [Pseudomonadota bacterium]
MAQAAPKIRLHIAARLAAAAPVALDRDQANYLGAVMRLGAGAEIAAFNGEDGEWRCRLEAITKRAGTLLPVDRLRAPALPPDLWLLFAPVKKARTDFIVEKAVELGCRRILPVLTQRTNAERVRTDRLQAHAVEAAEQCGLVFVPEIAGPQALSRVLDTWPSDRRLMFCDERAAGFGIDGPLPVPDAATALRAAAGAGTDPWAVLCGPEGGFDAAEAVRLAAMPTTVAAGLGPRILRTDTAAVAALTVWQSVLGDWRPAAGEAP